MSDDSEHELEDAPEAKKKGGKGKPVDENQFNRAKLVSAVSEKIGLPRAKTVAAVEAVFEAIEGALKNGNEVRLMGFGTFTVADRKAGTGRNPRTGEEIAIPRTKSVRFRPGKTLKNAIAPAEHPAAE